MAIREMEHEHSNIVATPPVIKIGTMTLRAPKASAQVAGAPAGNEKNMIEALLEYGADAYENAVTSTTVRLLEKQIATFDEQLAETLDHTLSSDRTELTKGLTEILRSHEAKITGAFKLYLDPDSTKGIQETVAKRLEVASKDIEKRVRRLLDDGDEGALACVVKELRSEIREATSEIVRQIGARHAVLTKTALSGRPYETAVTETITRLSQLTGDQVEQVGDSMGVLKRKTGDVLVTVDTEVTNGEDIRVVAEAKRRDPKAQPFSVSAIAKELERGRANREAEAGIFIAESSSMLPQGSPFGQVSPCDFFVEYDPTKGDDLGLAVALRLARVAALKECASGHEGVGVDLDAADAAVAELRQLLPMFGDLLSINVTIRKAADKSDTRLSDLRTGILAALRKIDRALRDE